MNEDLRPTQQPPQRAFTMIKTHVRDSIRQVNIDRWVIANRISLVRTSQNSSGCWSDGNGSFFGVSEFSGLLVDTSDKHPFKKVYDAGDKHVVWQLGEAFLKIVDIDSLDGTREHNTLQFLDDFELGFEVPKVLFHSEWEGRYLLIVSQVSGMTSNELWPTMNETARSKIVKRVSAVCESLTTVAAGKSDHLGGVDGRHLPHKYMAESRSPTDFSSATLLRNCHEMGMDCSTLVFHHCDLGPTNILFDVFKDSLSIIDWECAGFVPREWIRTKFRVCGGMDLENCETIKEPSSRHDYRRRIAA